MPQIFVQSGFEAFLDAIDNVQTASLSAVVVPGCEGLNVPHTETQKA